MQIKKKEINKIVIVFLFSHLFIWTLVPSITNPNLPLDTIEALAWGNNLDWGFNKHPPLSGFITEIFFQIFGNQDWAYYFLSQIFVIFSFFIIFEFSKNFFSNPIFGLISILLLEGIYFYNFTTPEFNVNVCQLPFWALSVFYCWRGFDDNKTRDWLLFGLFAGLGFLSKYLFVYLLLAMDIFFIYMIYKKKINYKCFISLIPFLIILIPHFIWLIDNNYITITYALDRTGAVDLNFFKAHLVNPFIFLGKQAGILIPFFIMFLFLVSKIKKKFNFKDKKLLFLLSINLIPIILVFLTSMLMGVKIRTMWMTPFYLFWGVLLTYLFQEKIKLNRLKNFSILFLFLFIFSPVVYFYVSITEENKRTDYPGREIAAVIQNAWDEKYKEDDDTIPIAYVTPDEWHAGNLSYHLKDRPKLSPVKKFTKVDDFFLSYVTISEKPLLCENNLATREKAYNDLNSDLRKNIEASGFIYEKINNLHICLTLILYKT